AAQILLTAGEIADRVAYVNVRNALAALFRLGAVPIVNENDATATDEITFGDNDALAAQVAVLVRARLLVLLTEVDGVYSRAPGRGRGGRGGGRRRARAGRGLAVGPRRHAEQGAGGRDGRRRGHPDRDRRRPWRLRARPDPRRRAARNALRARRTRAIGLQ